MESLNIAELFDTVCDGNKAFKAKPDPEVFLIGACELGIENSRCAVFEDSIAGITAAKTAGMLAIGVGNDLLEGKADYFIKNLLAFNVDQFF